MRISGIGLMLAAASMAVAGCASGGVASAGSSAPPGAITSVAQAIGTVETLRSTIAVAAAAVPSQAEVDSKLSDALRAYDVALSGVDFLVKVGTLPRNSPRALAVRTGLVRVKHLLLGAIAARNARSAGSDGQILSALADAKSAIAEVRTAIGS
jgi:hypothetical protein